MAQLPPKSILTSQPALHIGSAYASSHGVDIFMLAGSIIGMPVTSFHMLEALFIMPGELFMVNHSF